jgi:hypothetical protein
MKPCIPFAETLNIFCAIKGHGHYEIGGFRNPCATRAPGLQSRRDFGASFQRGSEIFARLEPWGSNRARSSEPPSRGAPKSLRDWSPGAPIAQEFRSLPSEVGFLQHTRARNFMVARGGEQRRRIRRPASRPAVSECTLTEVPGRPVMGTHTNTYMFVQVVGGASLRMHLQNMNMFAMLGRAQSRNRLKHVFECNEHVDMFALPSLNPFHSNTCTAKMAGGVISLSPSQFPP